MAAMTLTAFSIRSPSLPLGVDMTEKPATKSPWLKKVLIPFWIIQLIFTTMLLGVTCYLVTSGMPPAQLIVLITCIISLLLDITEIILFAIHNLRPVAYLIFQCVKSAIWFIVLMIAIVITTDQQRIGVERYSLGLLVLLNGLLEAVVLVLIHVGTLIYASIIYHRYRVTKADERRISIDQARHGRFHSQLDTAEYQTLDSPSDQQSNYIARSLVERDGADFRPEPMPSLTWTQGLRIEGEVHELATTRSVRSLEREPGSVQASKAG